MHNKKAENMGTLSGEESVASFWGICMIVS